MTRFASRFVAAAGAATLAAAPALRAQDPVTINFSEYACTQAVDCPDYQATIGRPLTSKGFEFYDYATSSGAASSNSLGTWSSNAANLGFANRPTNIGGSTTLFGTGTTDRIEMYSASGAPFQLRSIDIAYLFRRSSISTLTYPTSTTIYFQYFKTLEAYDAGTPDGDFSALITAGPLDASNDRAPVLRTLDFMTGTVGGSTGFTWRTGSLGDLMGSGVYGVQFFQGDLTSYTNVNTWTLTQGSGRSYQFTNVVAAVVPEPSTFALAAAGMAVAAGAGLRRRRMQG